MQSAAQLIGVLTFIVATLATPLARGIDWPGSSWFGSPPAVGTKEWWDKHVEDRVFVIGKGYTVPGVDGYFDGNGHPMTQMGATAANPAGIPVVAIARPDADKDKEA